MCFFHCYVYVIMLTLNCCSSIKIIVWGKKRKGEYFFLQTKHKKYKQKYIKIYIRCWRDEVVVVGLFVCSAKVKELGVKWNGKWMEKQPSFFCVCCIYTYFLYYIYIIYIFSTILSSRLSHVKLPTCCWQFFLCEYSKQFCIRECVNKYPCIRFVSMLILCFCDNHKLFYYFMNCK